MNKTKIMLIAAGSVTGVLILVAAFLVWSALSAKTAAIEGDDENDGLDGVVAKAQQLSRKDIYPSAASVKEIAADIEKVEAWKAEALKLVSKGDRAFNPTTAAAFKTFVVADAKRLQEGFEFGPFKEYVAGGKLPETTELPRLQRQWDDIALITESLIKCGLKKLTQLEFARVDAVAQAPAETEAKSKKGKKKAAKKDAAEETKFAPAKESYVFTFVISPDGFVKVLNELATCERFVVVDSFTFRREQDAVLGALGGEQKQSGAAAASGGRRSRRRAAAQAAEEKKDDEKKGGIITDPLLDPPMIVTMNVSVYDFGSLEEAAQ